MKGSTKVSDLACPFIEARKSLGYGEMDDQNDPVKMLLRLDDVKEAAKNWQDFTSDTTPGRIVIPSEVSIRDTRQVPFEMDPPEHTSYRALIEDWFKRPMASEYTSQLTSQIILAIDNALELDSLDVISELALPIQSRALTLLLNIPESEAETWISWGTHVFRSEGEALDANKANVLYDYIDQEIEKAEVNPGEDLYSFLLKANIDEKKLTKEEIKGVMVLTFAGGRDTIINSLTNSIAYFAEHPESLQKIQEKPRLAGKAVEEFIRYFSPLTQMGRVVTKDTLAAGQTVAADSRISICWASANRDETVFENPNEIMIERKANPHVGFGFGHHKCLGAAHARQVLKIFIQTLAQKVESISILDHQDNIEDLGEFKRKVGFNYLKVQLNAKT